MPDYAVGTAFNARDNVTKAFDSMGKGADRFAEKSSSAFRNVTKAGYSFNTIVKGILAAQAIHGGINMIRNGVQGVSSDFLQFDDIMVGAAARFDDMGYNMTDAGKRIDDLKHKTRQLALGTKYSAVDVAKGMSSLSESGWESKSALGVVPIIMRVATAANEDFAETVSTSNDLLSAFGLRTKDSTTNVKNMTMMTDMLAQAAIDANGGFKDLFENLKTSAPIYAATGESVASTLAFATILQNAGLKGEMGATAMKNMRARLFDPNVQAFLKAGGVEVTDKKTGLMRKETEILKDVPKAMSKFGIKQGSAAEGLIAKIMFGMWGLAGGLKILRSLKDLEEEEERIRTKSVSASEGIADFTKKYSAMYKLGDLKTAAVEKIFKLFDAFEGGGKSGIDNIIAKVNAFDMKPIIQATIAFAGAVGILYTAFKPFLPILPWVAFSLLTIKGVMGAWGIGKFVFGVVSAVIGFTRWIGAINAVKTAWMLLDAAFTLSPLGMLILAGTSIITAAYSAITGKDNWISELAQSIGLVPKLEKGANGKPTGEKKWWLTDPDLLRFGGPESEADRINRQNANPNDRREAPNAQEAAARVSRFQGTLQIAGAPAGSTFTNNSPSGAPSLDVYMLGVNP